MTDAEHFAAILAQLKAEDAAFLREKTIPRWLRRAASLAERDAAVCEALAVHAGLAARPAAEALAAELRRASTCPHAQGDRARLLRRVLDLSGRPIAWRRIFDIGARVVQKKNDTLHKAVAIPDGMSDTHLSAAEAHAMPLSALSADDLRAELAELIAADLLSRFERLAPRDRARIELFAGVAAGLAQLTKLFAPGCDPRVAPLLLNGIRVLTKALCCCGTDRIAGCFAELILIDAYAVRDAALASIAPAGTA